MRNTPYSARILLFFAVLFICVPTYMATYRLHEGDLLVSTGGDTGKGIFYKSVIFLEIHRHTKAYGVIVNKPMEDDFDKLPLLYVETGIPLYFGGPVDYPDRVFLLRTTDGKVRMEHINESGNDESSILQKLEQLKDEPGIYRTNLRNI